MHWYEKIINMLLSEKAMYKIMHSMLTLFTPIKLVCKDTEKTSNHGYLFWGTEVGRNWVAVSTEVGGRFSTL